MPRTDHGDFPILSRASIWAVSGFEERGGHPRTAVRVRFCWGHTSGGGKGGTGTPAAGVRPVVHTGADGARPPGGAPAALLLPAPRTVSVTLAAWLHDGAWLWLPSAVPGCPTRLGASPRVCGPPAECPLPCPAQFPTGWSVCL